MGFQSSLLFITTGVNILLSFFVFFGKKTATNIIYSAFVFSVAVWALGLALFILDADLVRAVWTANIYYVAAAAIPAFFLYFSISFLEDSFHLTLKNALILLPLLVLICIFAYDSHFLVLLVEQAEWGKNAVLDYGHYFAYSMYFLMYVSVAYYIFFRRYRMFNTSEERLQLKFIIGGTAVAFLLGMVFNLFLPFLGNYQYIWLGPVFTLIMVASIGYAITRHHLFDMKVVATQLITFSLWIVLLVRVFLSSSNLDQIINIVLLIIVVIFGTFLIRSVIKEVATRERIEGLAKDLAKANDRLKELDSLKSEFLSIASHQIRAPITAIKGYASLILEENFGKVAPELKEAVDVIFESSKSMAIMVDDFLNISRIEQGRMKYDLTINDLSALATQVVDELKPTVEKKGLAISFTFDKKANYEARLDAGKIKQAVTNLIDNAIKYTPKGSIHVNLARSGGKLDLTVKDTGMGISSQNIPKLFQKFSRAKDAITTNVGGTGLGLYVVKQMVEGHEGGKVWVESPGEHKGATFHIEVEAFEKR
ncbi:MAG: ATP-binding protein [bacterium]